MNTKKDSVPTIDLHYKKYEKYNTAATICHVAALVSLASLYYITPGNAKGFLIPAGFLVTSIGFHYLSGREFNKSKNYLDSE
jgi:hypothetical protein